MTHAKGSRDITQFRRQIQQSYDAFKAKGLRLNLTRGKPSSAQLDLSVELLSLPGLPDYVAEDGTDCRNYGNLQGIPEARRLFSGMLGAAPEQVVVGNNSSLSTMHDAVMYSLLKGTCDSTKPGRSRGRSRFCVQSPAMTGISGSARITASEWSPYRCVTTGRIWTK